jgi:hypothetical protein
MTILSNQRDCSVRKEWKNDRTAVMVDDFTLIGHIAFLDPINGNVENAALKNFFTSDDLRQWPLCIRHGLFPS